MRFFLWLFLGLLTANISYAQSLSFSPNKVSGGCKSATYEFITSASGGTITDGRWILQQNTGEIIINQGEANFDKPQLSYVVPGFYSATLEAKVGGTPLRFTDFLTVYSLPDVFISVEYGVSDGTAPYKISFHGSVTPDPYLGEIDIWEWSFNNGVKHYGKDITIDYKALIPDIPQVVQLRVLTKEGCHGVRASIFFIINIPKPIADFTPSPPIGFDTPHEVQFTDKSYMTKLPGIPDKKITQWFWKFGDGGTSTEQHPKHTYNAYGDYPVTLSVGSEDNIFASVTKIYPIHKNIPDFTHICFNNIHKDTIPDNMNFVFLNTSTPHPGVSIQKTTWDYGNGTPHSKYNRAGTYEVNMTSYFSDGDVRSKKGSITVLNSHFTHEITCQNEVFLSAVQTTDVTQYQWTIYVDEGSQYTATTTEPTYSFVIADNKQHKVALDLISPYSSCPSYEYVQIKPKFKPVIHESKTECPPYEYEFRASTHIYELLPGDKIVEYSWVIKGDQNLSFTTSVDYDKPIKLSGLKSYSVHLTARSLKGCVEDTLLNVKPTTGFSISCLSESKRIPLNIDAGSIKADKYVWEFISVGETIPYETFITTTNDLYLSPTYRGTSEVKVTASNTTCLNSITFETVAYLDGVLAGITVTSPSVVCGTTGTFEFTNQSLAGHDPNFDIYTVNWGDKTSHSGYFKTLNHTYTSAGRYNIFLTITNTKSGCVSYASTDVLVNDIRSNFTLPPVSCTRSITLNPQLTATKAPLEHTWKIERKLPNGSFQVLHNVSGRQGKYSYLFPNIGDYRVTYQTDCGISITQTTKVMDLRADFLTIPNKICENSTLTITDASTFSPATTSIVEWKWDFGDGTVQTYTDNRVASHTYTRTGRYKIRLTVKNIEGCKSSKEFDILVTRPTARFTIGTEFCPNDVLNFRDKNTSFDENGKRTNLVSYLWDFDDGTTSNSYEPWHKYSTAGFYTVSLTVTDISGCQHTVTKDVRVYPTPDSDFTVVNHPIGIGGYAEVSCVTEGVILEKVIPDPNIVGYLWEYGDGFLSTKPKPDPHFYAKPGRYSPKLTLYHKAGCNVEVSKLGFISIAGPVGSFTHTPEYLCYPQNEFFTAGAATFLTALSHYEKIEWDFGDGLVEVQDYSALGENAGPPSSTVSHTYAKPGVFYPIMTLIDHLNCRTPYPTELAPIKSSGKPIAQFTANYTTFLCAKTQLQLQDQSKPDPATDIHPNRAVLRPDVASWQWDFVHNNIIFATSTQQNPTFNFDKAGNYEIRLTVASQYELDHNIQCRATTSKFITVVSPSISTSYLIDNPQVCPNGNVQFRDNVSFATINGQAVPPARLEYTWDFGDGTKLTGMGNNPAITNPQYAYKKGGFYSVSLTIKDYAGCAASDIKTSAVHVYNTIADFTPKNPVGYRPLKVALNDISTTTDTKIVDWEWHFPSGNPMFSTVIPFHSSTNYAQRNPPELTYHTKGEFLVFLTVTTSSGCVETTFQTVRVLNNAPEITEFSVVLLEDIPHRFGQEVFQNHYSDKDNDPMLASKAIFISVLPTNGKLYYGGHLITTPQYLSWSALDQLTYSPNFNYNGTDQFTWQAVDSDGELSNPATVNLTITAVNDAPRIETFFITAKGLNWDVSFPNQFQNNYGDVEETPLSSIRIDCLPKDGILYFRGIPVVEHQIIPANELKYVVFMPNKNWSGTTSFCWVASDRHLFSNPAKVNITIPDTKADYEPNYTPRVGKDSLQAIEDKKLIVNLLGNDYDILGSVLKLTTNPLIPPKNGTVTLSKNGIMTYIPNPDFTGTDSLMVEICNSIPFCTQSWVKLTILPQNDPPTAISNHYLVPRNGIIQNKNVLTNDFDRDGDLLRIKTTPIEEPDLGTVVINSDGTFDYTPNTGALGVDYFTYEVCDRANPPLCSRAIVFLTITARTNLPTIQADNYTIQQDSTLEGNVLANDSHPNDGVLQATLLHPPKYGSVILDPNGTFIFIPQSGFVGTDQFTYQVCTSLNFCTTQTVHILHTSTDEPQTQEDENYLIVNSDTACVEMNGVVSGNVLINDFDPEEDPLHIGKIIQYPANGVFLLDTDGSFAFTPTANFKGDDFAIFEVCDAKNLCLRSSISFCKLYTVFTPKDTVIQADTNRAEVDIILPQDTWVIPFSGQTVGGNISIDSLGTFIYEGEPCFSGTDSLTYQVCDSQNCLPVVVYIEIPEIQYSAPVVSEVPSYQITTTGIFRGKLPPAILSRTDIVIQPKITTTAEAIPFQLDDNGIFILQIPTNTSKNNIETDSVFYQVCPTGDYAECTPCTEAKLRFWFDFPTIEDLTPLIPNAISPNGDSVNDLWKIPPHPKAGKISLVIYNRWGNIVYENHNYQNNWEGQCNQGIHINDRLPVGTYFYVIEYENIGYKGGFLELRR